jgi:hypothetical protein
MAQLNTFLVPLGSKRERARSSMHNEILPPTPLNLLDNWKLAHGVDEGQSLSKLPADAFEDLLERVREYDAAWRAPERQPDEIRLTLGATGYRGSLLLPASAVAFTDSNIEIADAHNGSGGVVTSLRSQFAAAFLYADRVVDVDPVSVLRHTDPGARPYVMAVILNLYEAVRPAVEAGVLLMVPDLLTEEIELEDEAAVADEAPFSSCFFDRHSERGTFDWIFLRAVRQAARIAERAKASIFARFPWQWEYVAFIGGARAHAREVDVATALVHAELPVVGGIRADTLVKIHQEEDALVEWRSTLRAAARLIRSSPTDIGFAEEATEVYRDVLVPRITAVRRAASRSAALRAAPLEQPARAALGALFASGPAAVAGLPIKGILLSAGTGAASNTVYQVLHRPKPTGSDAILSMLLE